MSRDHAALVRFLAERAAEPFVWGRRANDCAAFAGGAVLAQTGRDPLKGLHWGSKSSALKLIGKLGGLEQAVSARLRRIEPAHAHRGDVAGVIENGELLLMVVEGAMLVGPGNRRATRSVMSLAWSAD